MYKDRLDEIKATYECTTEGDASLSLPNDDIEWLIEIAENQQHTIDQLHSEITYLRGLLIESLRSMDESHKRTLDVSDDIAQYLSSIGDDTHE